ncbi:hypothetical protein PIB30_076481 [Stylosanthes scabra]|uniref:Uncharacterized protein n=1 Tax=Stylosanthes scabra TaxID=79078 RepID=A0ABU6YP32_9FABA|nr:hypothetical protein [Stylosanthes scabra]
MALGYDVCDDLLEEEVPLCNGFPPDHATELEIRGSTFDAGSTRHSSSNLSDSIRMNVQHEGGDLCAHGVGAASFLLTKVAIWDFGLVFTINGFFALFDGKVPMQGRRSPTAQDYFYF